jgi:endonuclease YncB( thermonuclease family)
MKARDFIGRRLTRKQAVIIGIIIMLFPLCAVLSVGYRIYDDYLRREPTRTFVPTQDTSTPQPETTESSSTGSGPTITQHPTETVEGTATGIPSPTLPPGGAAACVSARSQRQVGEVIQIVDGDTIKVRIGEDEAVVHYIGINAPDLGEPLGDSASDANRDLVIGNSVTLVRDVTNFDSSGTLLRYVFVGDIFVNYELVRQGYAEAVDSSPDSSCSDLLHTAEEDAQSDDVGIWALTPEPTRTLAPLWTDTPGPVFGKCTCTGEDNLDCDDFRNIFDANQCFLKCNRRNLGDFYHLDPDGDNLACN